MTVWEDLSEFGLRVRNRDGSEDPLVGVAKRYWDEWTHEALQRMCEERLCIIYVPAEREDALLRFH